MIKPVQKTEKAQVQPSTKIKGNEKKTNFGNDGEVSPELMAAQYKYGLACLYTASAKMENEKLKQELANATAQVNYRKAC